MTIDINRAIRWLLFIIGVLAIPLIAMPFTAEVNWDVTDFLVMGSMLLAIGLSYELIARKSDRTVYRVAFGVGLLGALLLFWVNGAVGIIGNEGQDANLLYGFVIVTGVVGSILSRFKAKGMSVTLYSVAVVQMLVPVIALLIWPPSVTSWSPGVLTVFLLNGFFAFLFCISGVLFARAAENKEIAF